MNYEALGTKLIIVPEEIKEEVSTGGIIKAQTIQAKQLFRKAKVVSVGRAVVEEVKPGDEILYMNGSGGPLLDEGQEFTVIEENSLVAIHLPKQVVVETGN